jgi:hypothetical protein
MSRSIMRRFIARSQGPHDAFAKVVSEIARAGVDRIPPTSMDVDGHLVACRDVLRQHWNNSDILPSDVADDYRDIVRRTYGDQARFRWRLTYSSAARRLLSIG